MKTHYTSQSCSSVGIFNFRLPFLFVFLLFFSANSFGQTPLSTVKGDLKEQISIEKTGLTSLLENAPLIFTSEMEGTMPEISLPLPGGRSMSFYAVEWSNMASELAKDFPEIKSYALQSIANSAVKGRINLSSYGVYAVISTENGMVVIEPMEAFSGLSDYYVYYDESPNDVTFSCGTVDDFSGEPESGQKSFFVNSCFTNGDMLRTARLAIATTGEFFNLNGGTMAGAMAAIDNRVMALNVIYENEVAIHFELIANNNLLISTNPATDPFTDPDGMPVSNNTLNETQTFIDNTIGTANYDIGHGLHEVAGFSIAGRAGLGVVCNAASKGTGFTQLFNGNSNIIVMAHEFGHMFSCRHTNYGCSSANDCERYEPGQGSTIMSTSAGCIGDDFYANRTNYFSVASLDQILNFVTNGEVHFDNANCTPFLSGDGMCLAQSATGNTIPTSDANPNNVNGGNIIPANTPFILQGAGTDPDAGNTLTYTWEQYDQEIATSEIPANTGDNLSAPLFRSFPPSTNSDRVFPQLSSQLNGNVTIGTGETLPGTDRTMNFRLIVRDNNMGAGAIACDAISIDVVDTGTPFAVTSQNTATNLVADGANTFDITWNVAGTTAAPINCANVDILFSTDGGQTFPNVLASNVPNDNNETLVVPNLATTQGVIRVICSDNIFFDINDAFITITSACAANGVTFSPMTDVTANQGDATLNLNLMPDVASMIAFPLAGDIDGTEQSSNSNGSFECGTTNCTNFGGGPFNYDNYDFYVDVAGDYTFSIITNFSAALQIFEGDFDVNAGCANLLGTSRCHNPGNIITGTVSPVTVSLTSGVKYSMAVSNFFGGAQTGNYTVSIDVAPAGGDLFDGANIPLDASFSYNYVAVNAAGDIIDINDDSDFTGLAADTYTVYGISFENTENLNPYINGTLAALEADILNSTVCANLSSNTIALMINGIVPCSELFISEYVEGSGVNKCIELYNPTAAAIDLTAGNYQMLFFSNGSTTISTMVNLTGIVASGDVFVICDDGADAAFLAAADQTPTNSFFNGNDAVAIVANGITIDVFGRIGEDPGAGWSAANCGGGTTANQTFRRKASVQSGDTNGADVFDPCVEYDVFAENTSAGIGAHTSICQACDLTDAGETLETCNDNGTAADALDDFITFSLNPTGLNLGATYSVTSDNGGVVTLAAGGAAMGIFYNVATAFRLQNGSADGATTFTITVTDVSGAACTVTTAVMQNSCSSACDLTDAGETLETCNDNGTAADALDDFITFSLNPTGLNLGATYSVTSDNGGVVTLAAGGAAMGIFYNVATAFRLQNGSADGATTFTITVTDVSGAACTVTTAVMQNSCSSACDLTDAGETLETCNDNGTAADALDDFITFSLNPTGLNLGATYSVTSDNGGVVTLAAGGAAMGIFYNVATAFRLQNGSADGATTFTITVTDVSGAACTVTTAVMQNSCSSACDLTDAGETLETCNDNGTAADALDDFITFSLNPTGLNLGATYSVTSDNGGVVTLAAGGAAMGIFYNVATAFRLQNGSADGATTFTITVTDVSGAACTVTTAVMQNSCSSACDLTDAGETLETCNDNGTAADALDDFITFSLNPTGLNLGATYSVTSDNGGVVTLAAGGAAMGIFYNVATAFRLQNGSADGATTFTITVTDVSGAACTVTTAVMQNSCSSACDLTDAGETLETCNDNGTAADALDDFITFSLNPTGLNLGATYSVTSDNGGVVTLAAGGAAMGIFYNVATAFRLQNGSADGATTFTITVTDVSGAACTVTTAVMQNSCSSACDLTDAGETLETCNDNGTAADALDDFITFSLNPTGLNLGATYSVTSDNGGVVTLAAGGAAMGIFYNVATAFRLQNGSADGATTFTITVTDVSGAACTVTTAVMQNSCSSACDLTDAGETLETCNDNGTAADALDDFITFSLNPTGLNLGATYSVTSDNGGVVTLAAGGAAMGIFYNVATAFRLQNGSADGATTFTITVTDVSGAACTVTTAVMQNSCSSACDLTDAGETLETCNDNGTAADALDDFITFSLNPTGLNLGATYSVTSDNGGVVTLAAGGAAMGIFYNVATAFRLQNGSADGATTFTITVTDVSGAACTVTTAVMQNSCSGGVAACSQLFISEYVEGGGLNKCIELYNPTGAAIDLAAGNYQMLFYSNGNAIAGVTIPLIGTVAAGDVYVICDNDAAAEFLARADQTPNNSFFNGDDAIEILANGTTIDVFGRIGEDPGAGWTATCPSGTTANQTLRRKMNIQSGDNDGTDAFDPCVEYDVFAQDASDGIGGHISACIPCNTNITNVAVTKETCAGDDNGTITITADTDNGELEYSIDGVTFQASNVFNALPDATYTVTARNVGTTCTATDMDNVVAPGSNVTITNVATTPETCAGDNDGIITVTGTCTDCVGTIEYSIDGVTFQASNVFMNQAAATYTVTARDDMNITCTATDMDNVVGSGSNAQITNVMTTNETCAGDNDGTITVTATCVGCTGNVEYSIDGVTFQPENTFTNLADNTYTVTVRDDANTVCTFMNANNVIAPGSNVTITNVATTPETCAGDNDGIITVTGTCTDCVGTIEYSIDGVTFQASNVFMNQAAATYTVTARDDMNTTCTATDIDNVIAPGSNVQITNVASTNETGPNAADGTITVTASCTDCLGNLEYSIDGINFQVSNMFIGLADDTYTITARDDANITCTDTEMATINTSCDIMFTSTVSTDETCEDANDGTITATGACTSCAVGFEFSIDGITFQPTGNFTDLADGTYTLTIRDQDDVSCTATTMLTVNATVDITLPAAICQNITINDTDDGNEDGAASITAADVDGGSTDNCALASIAIDIMDFDCSNVGENTVTLTAMDASGNSNTCMATVIVQGSQFCADQLGFTNDPTGVDVNGTDPCSCAAEPGFFDEELLFGPAAPGLIFVVQATTLLETGGTGVPIVGGTVFTETPVAGGQSIYTLFGQHQDGVGYTMTVTSPDFLGQVFTLSNRCFYPDPVINTLPADVICLFTDPIMLMGSEANGATDTGVFDINGVGVTELDPMTLGLGNFTLTYTFDADLAANFVQNNGVQVPAQVGPPIFVTTLAEAIANPGCEESVSFDFSIVENSGQLACNNAVQISLNENCEALITPDMLLEGDQACYDDFEITLKHNSQTVANPLTAANIGETIIGTVTFLDNSNSCWTTITVEDKFAPVVACTNVTIACTADAISVSAPIAVDNCDPNPIETLVDEVINTDNNCEANPPVGFDPFTVTIVRTYIAVDNQGNTSATCQQVITVIRPEMVDIPNDIIWTCEQYAAFPNIIEATRLIPNALSTTGSGVLGGIFPLPVGPLNPANGDISDDYCKYDYSNSDQVLSTCGFAASTDAPVFKIVRTWTVLDWCTGNIATNLNPLDADAVQIIKVIDEEEPTVVGADVTISANITGQHPQPCKGQGPILLGTATDNCTSPATNLQAFVHSDIALNSAVAQVTSIGNGYGILNPALPVGTYFLVYTAEDACGNVGQSDTYVLNIVDDITPVAVCDEITQISLSSDGLAKVYAGTFDDGSYDNCCLDRLEVRRMESNLAQACSITGNITFDNDGDPQDANNDPDNGEYVTFCCSDIGTTNMVVLRVFDCSDNYNECMVEVLVEDKLAPTIVCPPNATITCDDFVDVLLVDLLACTTDGVFTPANADAGAEDDCQSTALTNASYGTPVALDNCDTIIDVRVTVSIDQCGVGSILRDYIVKDPSDNGSTSFGGFNASSPSSCRQRISVTHVSNWCVEFPADLNLDCQTDEDDIDFGEPEIFFETCELIATSYVDQVFDIVPDACFKIARQWTVINWCTVGDEINQEIVEIGTGVGNRRFCEVIATPDGYITYQQVIKVNDDVAPAIVAGFTIDDLCIITGNNGTDNDFSDCSFSGVLPTPDYTDCITMVNDEMTGEDNGINNPIIITATVFDAADSIVFNSVIVNDLAIGCYKVRYTAIDRCGNTSVDEFDFCVSDCKLPTPYCKDGVVLELMAINDPNNTTFVPMVELWASDLDLGSFDNCAGEVQLSFSSNVNDIGNQYFCDNVGENEVELWVTDASGNTDFCTTFVIIQANQEQCTVVGDPLFTIGGNIATEANVDVADVEVSINGTAMNIMEMTNLDGNYNIDVPADGDYTIVPNKDINPLNGVSTFDMVKINKHILNIELLDSPYKMIAADANKSNSITTLDLVHIRKVVLFIEDNFTANNSWRFVDADYVFPDPTNPWLEIFPEIININNLPADALAESFVGVKIGDVTGNVTGNQLLGADDRSFDGTLKLTTQDVAMKAGETYVVQVNAANFHNFGYQFTLNFDTDKLELLEIENGLAKAENFGLTLLSEGAITTSWNESNPVRLATDEALFTLTFTAKANVQLSDVLNINSRYTLAEAYTENGDLQDIQLAFNNNAIVTDFALYQNTPNPFAETTKIGFNLPQAGNAVLTIRDVSGKVLTTIDKNFAKGYNEVIVSKEELSAKGVLYYQLETAEHAATKMMVIVR